MDIILESPLFFNVRKPEEKLVFYGKMLDHTLHSSYVFGENKEMFMLFLDEEMEKERKRIIYLLGIAFLLQ